MTARGFTHEPPHSLTVEWYTPPHVFDALGLVFDLDPCSAGIGLDYVPARERFTVLDNGLSQIWSGTVWCNPPYGDQTAQWLQRMKLHGDGVALVFARTGTRWWHDVAPSADVCCFVRGRIRFINGSTRAVAKSPGADSVLLAWGSRAAHAVVRSNLGHCVTTIP